MTKNELIKAKEEIYTIKKINDIKRNAHFIDFGSEVSCYNLTSKQVIKFFDMNTTDPTKKLLIDDQIYGTNTYPFADAIQTHCKQIISYTMKFVRGTTLDKQKSIDLFYNLSYNMLLEYLTILILDSKSIANHGIQAFDCRDSNIIFSPTGFRQIDCIDFQTPDKDPNIIEKTNIQLMCITIWDSLISPYLSTFLANNNLHQFQFTESPLDFIKELKSISQKYSDTKIITLGDTKKISKKK